MGILLITTIDFEKIKWIYNIEIKIKQMEKRVLSYHDFSGKKLNREDDNTQSSTGRNYERQNESHEQQKNYMFFQNLATIKHYIGEIMAMDKSAVDRILSEGHDWASDHLATAKDDVEEVTNFLRNEIEMGGHHGGGDHSDNIEVALDGADEKPSDILIMGDEEDSDDDKEFQVEIEPEDDSEEKDEETEEEFDDEDDKEGDEEEQIEEE